MSAFEYVALDQAGRSKSGVVAARDEAAARAALHRRSLAPVRLTPAAGAPAKVGPAIGGGKIGASALALVTRQLATLVQVAPLEEALRALAQQAERPKVRRLLSATHASVLEGYRLSDAMARQGDAFPPIYRAMVAAGERSGSLPSILERLADLLEKDQQVRSKVTTALVYPLALAAVATVVVIALMTFVVPKIVEQFSSMGQRLPLLTRIVIAVSEFLQDWGWLAAILLVLAVLGFVRAMRNEKFRRAVDRRLLAAPMVGKLIRDVHAASLARTLSTMIAGGLPLVEGLAAAARTVGNRVLRDGAEDMATAVREGGSLSAAMKRAGVFPPVLVYMTASGESAGRLEIMLARAADYLEREFNTFTAVALSLLEPAIIVIMGAVVATIVLSILLPILQLNTLALG